MGYYTCYCEENRLNFSKTAKLFLHGFKFANCDPIILISDKTPPQIILKRTSQEEVTSKELSEGKFLRT